jgi:acetyl-CoA synthetase
MDILQKYLPRTEFTSYDDFAANYKVVADSSFNFGFDVVDAIAKAEPQRRAVVWCNDHNEEKTLTMENMAVESAKAANFFRSCGIKKGDKVMLILKRHYAYWYAVVGLHKLGAVAIPATHQLMQKDIVYRVKAAGIKMIVTVDDPTVLDVVDEAHLETPLEVRVSLNGDREGWLSFNAGCTAAAADFPRPQGAEQTVATDIMLLYFTSGTTGMPKMVEHNFYYPLGHILTAKYWQRCFAGGVHLTVAETGWAKASWGKIYGQWLVGSAVMVYDYDRFNPARMIEVLQNHKVTTFCAPPTIYRYLLKEGFTGHDWSHLRYAVVAGEPLNPEIYNAFLEQTGLKLSEGYGQTEMTVAAATYEWMEPKPGSMGKASPGYNIDILAPDGHSCEVAEEGEIVVKTGNNPPLGMFNGYYNNTEMTKSVWQDGIYHTGDVAWRDADGYLWFVGRVDDVIKSSGYRIGPFEVESALLEHPAVLECAITGVPDPTRGAVVKATIVLAKGYTPSEELKTAIQNHVKHVTAPYKYPRIVEFVPELPKTISGKIRRVAIRDSDQSASN